MSDTVNTDNISLIARGQSIVKNGYVDIKNENDNSYIICLLAMIADELSKLNIANKPTPISTG